MKVKLSELKKMIREVFESCSCAQQDQDMQETEDEVDERSLAPKKDSPKDDMIPSGARPGKLRRPIGMR